MTDTQNKYPDGCIKVVHAELDSIKLSTKIKNSDGQPIGKTGKGVKIIYTHDFGTDTLQMPEGKFKDAALKVPTNKQIWKDLSETEWEDDEKVTLTFEREKGYWDLRRMEKGHIGVKGIARPGQGSGQTNNNTSPPQSYDNVGAAVGQIMNIALAMITSGSKKSFSVEDIQAKAEDIMEDVLVAKKDLEKLYRKLQKGVSSKPTPVDDKEDDKGKPEVAIDDDDDDEDDIPF